MDLHRRVAPELNDSLDSMTAYGLESPPLVVIMGRDHGARVALPRLLVEDGCEVVEAADAAAVAAIASTSSLLIAVADAADDDVVGELVVLRRLGYCAPAIVMAHGASSTLRHRAFALGVIDVIGFTGGPADVQARLRAALEYARHGYVPAGLSGGRTDIQFAD